MTYGTSYFASLSAAVRYYKAYGEDRADVERKVAEGSIHIGRPPLKAGDKLTLIDGGTRYAITSKNPAVKPGKCQQCMISMLNGASKKDAAYMHQKYKHDDVAVKPGKWIPASAVRQNGDGTVSVKVRGGAVRNPDGVRVVHEHGVWMVYVGDGHRSAGYVDKATNGDWYAQPSAGAGSRVIWRKTKDAAVKALVAQDGKRNPASRKPAKRARVGIEKAFPTYEIFQSGQRIATIAAVNLADAKELAASNGYKGRTITVKRAAVRNPGYDRKTYIVSAQEKGSTRRQSATFGTKADATKYANKWKRHFAFTDVRIDVVSPGMDRSFGVAIPRGGGVKNPRATSKIVVQKWGDGYHVVFLGRKTSDMRDMGGPYKTKTLAESIARNLRAK